MACTTCRGDHETDDHYSEAFTNPVTREAYRVPFDIRMAAERITRSYGIKGICDPMYVANVIGRETGRGDGESHFPELETPHFRCTIELGNEAFTSGDELPMILERLARRVVDGYDAGTIADSNGNTVGSWAILTVSSRE